MESKILTSFIVLLLFACQAKTENTMTTGKSETFFPKQKAIEKFDTIIADKQLQITITKSNLNTFVTNEYNIDGRKQIDNYRDSEIELLIEQNSHTILDTVFRKEYFLENSDSEFVNSAIFHGYWFNSFEENKIELLGTLAIPETDIGLSFYHHFDLNDKKLSFTEYIDNEN